MKKSVGLFLKTVFISLLCCSVLFFIGFLYLDSESDEVGQNTPSVPYYSEAPENTGVSFEIGGHKTYFFLDFYYKRINVIFNAEKFEKTDILGYNEDYYIKADYTLLSDIIDLIGGIELENESGVLRYTGVQITEMLSTSTNYNSLEREIIRKILSKIAQNGFGRQDFLYVIENSSTNLTVPVCYNWCDYIGELCKAYNEVN